MDGTHSLIPGFQLETLFVSFENSTLSLSTFRCQLKQTCLLTLLAHWARSRLFDS